MRIRSLLPAAVAAMALLAPMTLLETGTAGAATVASTAVAQQAPAQNAGVNPGTWSEGYHNGYNDGYADAYNSCTWRQHTLYPWRSTMYRHGFTAGYNTGFHDGATQFC